MASVPKRNDPQKIVAIGFQFYKKCSLEAFFADSQVSFADSFDSVDVGSVVAVWGATPVPDFVKESCYVLRLEDGFIRSVGLGADLIQPVSWVVDTRGMYFDATQPSDIEFILEEFDFQDALLERAASLRERIVGTGLTKYNVGVGRWIRPTGVPQVLLALGQVETDASIKFGSPTIKTNLGLLQAIRKNHPDAYLVYKPHPDVVAGLRLQGDGEDEAYRFCDEIVTTVDLADMFNQVDEIHVLTSLAGFEALLRGRHVRCYGQPFYAGWGLTDDLAPVPRRTRHLGLDHLVAGALILYPRYMSLKSRAQITPEQAIDELLLARSVSGGQLPWWRRLFRPILQRIAQAEDKLRKECR